MGKNTVVESTVVGNETVTNAQKQAISAEEAAQNKKMKELYEKQAESVKVQAKALAESQQAATDLAISQIEQRKSELNKDYKKEQSAAYTDYQKQINPYGANAEVMADNGLLNSGYSESSKVRMYNEYQRRYAINRSTYEMAIVNYNNAIAEAKRQNSVALAQLAYDALEKETALLEQAALYEAKGTVASVPTSNVPSGETVDSTVSMLNEEQLNALKQQFARNSMQGVNIATLQEVGSLIHTGAIDKNTGAALIAEFVPDYEEWEEILEKIKEGAL